MQTIFHLDLDAFFVSVERVLDPTLEGKPVIVGGDPSGRGVVAACSYEARKFGLHSAMPIKQAFSLCPHGIYLHGNFKEYTRYSRLVKNLLEQYAPLLQQASIDEFYIDFSGCQKIYGSFIQLAEKIQNEIWTRLKLPASIGIAGNKTVAKIASDFNKPRGITFVCNGMEKDFLAHLPVETIPGVGKVTLRELNSRGIYKVDDIAKLPIDYFSSALGKFGIDLWEKANGLGSSFIVLDREQKSISKENTFDKDVTDYNILYETLFYLIGKVCQNLRDDEMQASTINIKLRYSDFQTLTRSKTVQYTDDDKIIFEVAWNLLSKANTRRVGIRLIGVGVSNFRKYSEQELLFEDLEARRKKMLRAVNIIRSKYGFNKIFIGLEKNK